MTSKDPWKEIEPPSAHAMVNARRVDASYPWGFFWARDMDNRCILMLRHDHESRPRNRLPNLQGLELKQLETDESGQTALVLCLTEETHRDIFHRLCLDILDVAGKASSELLAVELLVARTWRWHHLLRGGRGRLLSPEEQKGLIGEMTVLEDALMPSLKEFDAVAAWTGPLDAPKDFQVGRICIESKARRGASTPFVRISSEHQLDTEGVDALFLHVSEIDSAPEGTSGAFTITDMAKRIIDQLASADATASDLFEERLTASGLNLDDDYSAHLWLAGSTKVFEVTDDFPSISATQINPGTSRVKYDVSLAHCEPFDLDRENMIQRLKKASHDD